MEEALFFKCDFYVNLSLVLSGSCFSIAIITVNLFPELTTSVPQFIRDVLFFGKMKDESKRPNTSGFKLTPSQLFNVPKSYFTHFYIFGAFFNLWYICRVLQNQNEGGRGIGEISANSSKPFCYFNNILAAFLIWLQIARRLYECLFVSTFSKSTMHLIHYVMGFFFYFIVIQMTLIDIYNGNVIVRPSVFRHAFISTPFLIFALICQVLQHGVLKQLAALRSDYFPKNNAHGGKTSHFMPSGALFDLVSCPHYLTEISFYASILFIIDHGYIRWLLVLLFVSTNQIYSAIVTHHWYIANFPNYPAQTRKAIIPFIL